MYDFLPLFDKTMNRNKGRIMYLPIHPILQ